MFRKRIRVEGPIRKRLRGLSKARNVGRIDQTRSGEANNRMHRCRPTPSFPSPRTNVQKRLRKQLTLFPSARPKGIGRHRYFTVMFNNSQTARWRESPVSAPPLHLPLPLPSTPFQLFRRLISCLVEDVVVAISFASRGAWATSSMKWTTCLSYRIWLTMEWGEGVILLWTLFFSFSFFGGKGEGKGNGRFFKENWRSEAGRRKR